MHTQQLTRIFLHFLKLGCLSFGGPAAHLVFFHRHFVQQLRWLSDAEYTQLVALAQLLPGPTSSQVGIAIGYQLQGYRGACAAWLGFTLPSMLLMACFAVLGQQYFNQLSAMTLHSIQLIVFAVVVWAFWQMLTNFCKTIWQYVLMLLSTLFLYFVPWSFSQVIVIFVAALVGIYFASDSTSKLQDSSLKSKVQAKQAYLWLIAFVLPFVVFIVWHSSSSLFSQSLFSFYHAASLVFGGGHIILPLLHQDFVVSHILSAEQFDLGYALAQLMPGPLFSFASYLGALLPLTPFVWLNVVLATLAIFLPSFFLIFAALPYWSWLMQQAAIRKAVIGINAAVVSLLLCLVIQMGQSYFKHWTDLVLVIAVILLLRTKLPIWLSLISSFALYQLFFYFSG
ncbi:chromate efflux transporter [Acinetobacter johnsonii]|uniref:chromate efflux transporter n=1 Tax=Acinetobacter johnsonii TaxID=40214 RepID=UPI003F55D0F9